MTVEEKKDANAPRRVRMIRSSLSSPSIPSSKNQPWRTLLSPRSTSSYPNPLDLPCRGDKPVAVTEGGEAPRRHDCGCGGCSLFVVVRSTNRSGTHGALPTPCRCTLGQTNCQLLHGIAHDDARDWRRWFLWYSPSRLDLRMG